MKTKHKKWLYVSLIISLAIPVILLHLAFNGNPLSKYIAKRHLENYLTETYPEQTLNIENGIYNFKDSGYSFDVLTVAEDAEADLDKYEFVVHGVLKMTVGQDGIYNDNLDERLMERLGNEASEALEKALDMGDVDILDTYVQMEVLKGTYHSDISWDADFEPEEPMDIHITFDASNKTEADVLEIAKYYQEQLEADSYDYRFVSINGNIPKDDFELGYVKYAISFEADDTLTPKDVQKE